MKISAKTLRWVTLVALLAAAHAGAQDGTMYSWTDENGVVHFSDTAPPGQDVQPQSLPSAVPPGSVSPEPDPAAAPSAAQQRREEIARKADETAAQQELNKAQCAGWQAELERLEPNRRVYSTNEQGETERMDDVVRTDRVAELHDLIGKNCR
jgi:hypothetical protein